MFDVLSSRLTGVSSLFSSKAKTLEESAIQEACQVLRRALLEADVSYRVVRQFVQRVRQKALDSPALDGWDAEDQFMGLMHQELVALLGDALHPLKALDETVFTPESPALILMCGLQGAGKTTTSAKLAQWLTTQNKATQNDSIRPFLIAADTVRPAAMAQLAILGERLHLPVYKNESATSMLDVVEAGLREAKASGATHVIVDTAGRLQVDTDTMSDLVILKARYQPQDVLLVVDAMIGQESVNVVEAFHTQVGVTGCILSKMDGDTKGGAMLSIREATGIPIQFLGTGETPNALEAFHPDRMAQRLMGMGDLATLFEKAMSSHQDTRMASVTERLMQGKVNFQDYLHLQESIQKMGGLSMILNMLPMMQMNASDRNALGQDHKVKLKQWKALIGSMTEKERLSPRLVLESDSRQSRLFKGAGLDSETGTALITEFSQLFEMAQGLKMMSSFFGGSPDDEVSFQASALLKDDSEDTNEDDPMGWGDFFSLFEEEKPTQKKQSQKKKSPSPFPW
jgi:signal recognition particle subunit SRP54